MDFKNRMKVAKFLFSKERMKNFGTNLKGICKSSVIHHEVVVTKGLNQKNSRMVTHVAKKYGLRVFV